VGPRSARHVPLRVGIGRVLGPGCRHPRVGV